MCRLTRSWKCVVKYFFWLSAVVLLLIAAGCGDGRPKRVPVCGQVLIDGKPLEVGFIQVVPQSDRPAFGTLGPEGRFALTTYDENDGCVLGKHPVAVIAKKDLSSSAIQWFAPKKYRDPKTSGLTVEILGPRSDLEIHLSWNGGKPFIERFESE